MSRQYPVIIYVGHEERAEALRLATQPCGWSVYHPTETMEALAMNVFYYPDLVVIEDTPENEMAQDVYRHLRSIQMESLLIITDAPWMWDIPDRSIIQTVSYAVGVTKLADEIARLVGIEHPVFRSSIESLKGI